MSKRLIRFAVIDDERVSAIRLQEHLAAEGYPVDVFFDGESFLESYRCAPHDLVITDMKLPGIDGLEVLKQIKARINDTEVVVITGYATISSAIEAIQAGAFHYLTKPIRLDEFDNLISQVVQKIQLRGETQDLRALVVKRAGLDGMVGTSTQITGIFELIEKVAPLDCPVIVQGESGTGKELVAKAIHRRSHRKDQSIVSLNCGGFSPELIANELFGHEKGAFTGAFNAKPGLLESANHGTVLLDEIAEMPMDMQVKLLRVLQEGQIFRLGSNRPVHLDIRILAASNRNLEKEVAKGAFREDLYFRLNIMKLHLPPLKDREGDLWLIADHFLHKFNKAYNKNVKGFGLEAREALSRYNYPGNVRELENIIARGVAITENSQIRVEDLPPHLADASPAKKEMLVSLQDLEKKHIHQVLQAVSGQREKAAEILGITRSTLWRKMKKYNLTI